MKIAHLYNSKNYNAKISIWPSILVNIYQQQRKSKDAQETRTRWRIRPIINNSEIVDITDNA